MYISVIELILVIPILISLFKEKHVKIDRSGLQA